MKEMKKTSERGISFTDHANADPGALSIYDRDESIHTGGWACMSIVEVHQS